ncbi:MAG: RNA methyltransferase [Gammaproteobacteria bacterium]
MTYMPNANWDNLCFVLVGTTHPGNIGAAARAMKSMGIRRLALVQPKHFPCAEATAMASGADDLLAEAEVWSSLSDALRDYTTVVATSARQRRIDWPAMNPRRCAEEIARLATQQRVAIVFGREHSGLTNDELEYCNAMVRIPTVSDFSSLNLAAAVQILAYEMYLAGLKRAEVHARSPAAVKTPPASTEAMLQFYAHLQQTMTDVGFFDPQKPRRLMRRLRRLFNRTGLDGDEIQILRGFLAAVQGRRLKDPLETRSERKP